MNLIILYLFTKFCVNQTAKDVIKINNYKQYLFLKKSKKKKKWNHTSITLGLLIDSDSEERWICILAITIQEL